jgi:hypothetical protein
VIGVILVGIVDAEQVDARVNQFFYDTGPVGRRTGGGDTLRPAH